MLPSFIRKKLQVKNAGKKSIKAKKLKIADKICNIEDIINTPPEGWTTRRKLEYFAWAKDVINELGRINEKLEKKFYDLLKQGFKKIKLQDSKEYYKFIKDYKRFYLMEKEIE